MISDIPFLMCYTYHTVHDAVCLDLLVMESGTKMRVFSQSNEFCSYLLEVLYIFLFTVINP